MKRLVLSVMLLLLPFNVLFAAAPTPEDEALAGADFAKAASLFEKKAATAPNEAWKAAAAKLLAEQWPKAIEQFSKNLPANTKVGAYTPSSPFKDAIIKSADPAKGLFIEISGGPSSVINWRSFTPEVRAEILKKADAKPSPEQLHAALALLALHDLKDKAVELFHTLATPEAARDATEQEVARWIQARDAAKHEAEARSEALKNAGKLFAEKDEAKRAALLDKIGDAAVSAEEIAQFTKMIVPAAYPEQKPGIRDHVAFDLPASVSAKAAEYSIYVPHGYTPAKRYPLIFGLHGGGENMGSGDDAMKTTSMDIKGIEAIYVCPTSLDLSVSQYWRNPKNEELFILMIQELSRQYAIDTDRVFLSGYSMGGIGTYYLGPRLANYLAGMAPGGGAWSGVYWPGTLNLPTYIFHGKNDMRGTNFTNFDYAQNAADCLKDLKYDYLFRAMDCDHFHVPPGEHKKMFEWLLTKKRDAYAKHVILSSPSARDFSVPTAPSRPNRWLAIDETGDESVDMDGCEYGGTPRIKHHLQKMGTLDAKWTGPNQVEVTAQNVKRFRIFLSPNLMDLKKPLKVSVNGKVVLDAPVKTSLKFLLHYLDQHRDPNMVYAGEVSIDLTKAAGN